MKAHLGRDNHQDVVLRTIVADDDAIARRSIRDTLREAGITVLAEAVDGREAVELAIFHRPDVVVMDHMLPGIDGIEATRRLYEHNPSIRVVVLAEAHDDALGLRAVRAGAVGFLSKAIDLDALPRSLRGVRDGEAAISRRFAMTLIEHYRVSNVSGEGLRPVRSRLSPREWEVLDLLTTGLTADQIADSLVLSTETIRSHVKSVYRKLDVTPARPLSVKRRGCGPSPSTRATAGALCAASTPSTRRQNDRWQLRDGGLAKPGRSARLRAPPRNLNQPAYPPCGPWSSLGDAAREMNVWCRESAPEVALDETRNGVEAVLLSRWPDPTHHARRGWRPLAVTHLPGR